MDKGGNDVSSFKKGWDNRVNILIRADSSSSIGVGHIMRDLVLAESFKGENIVFACQNLEGNIIEKIPYKVVMLNSSKNQELIEIIRKNSIDLLIIDHYGIDYDDEKEIKDKTKVKILSFDDTYKKHYCDILLNHNICAKSKRYEKLVPTFCEIRCGKEYNLIRKEFIEEKKIKREKKYDFFISLGGADTANLTVSVLKSLPKDKKALVVTTLANKNIESLKKYIERYPSIDLKVDTNEMAKLLNQSKFAIITPSVTAQEVLYMGIPFLAIKTAVNNQNEMYKYLKEHNYLQMEKFDKQEFEDIIDRVIRDVIE